MYCAPLAGVYGKGGGAAFFKAGEVDEEVRYEWLTPREGRWLRAATPRVAKGVGERFLGGGILRRALSRAVLSATLVLEVGLGRIRGGFGSRFRDGLGNRLASRSRIL
jgi:hypothetical protein